jgi:catechol 2,3-dioxygenase-like lactoylglutathione lyase family enzyme
MKLGAFSISLSVKDLKASEAFYTKLGFRVFAGGHSSHYLIMKNGNALVGLFEGMFEGNILTFNPGWNENAELLEHFDDVRSIQKTLKEQNLDLIREVDADSTSGPGSITLLDPDGNAVLIDQHV